jgi:hypothetical protein
MFRPTVSTLNANSAGIINTIRDNASAAYQNAIPEVQDTTESIRAAGMQIMAFQPHMNEFVNALVNRIALVVVTSRRYSNPLSWAKKGVFENGETEEEVFVNAAEGMPYNANGEALDMFKLYKGDVRSAFHSLNMQTVYPISINDNELRLAFLSRDGVTDLISRKVESLYSGLSYDEYIMTKYVVARLALDGSIRAWTIPAGVTADELKQTVTAVKTVTNRFQFYSTGFNVAGVNNFTPVDGLYILTTSNFDAQNDVNVLASAFNIDRAEFIGRRAMVDTFAFNENEKARLAKLLEKDPGFQQITDDENEALSSIKAIAMDREFYRIYDVLPDRFTEQYDAIHLRWNEFLHAWRIYSASPFANAVMFTSTEITITGVTVNGPSTVAPGNTAVYTATVTSGDFANKGVVFSVDTGSVTAGTVEIDSMGHVTVSADAEGSFTVKAVSAVDSTKNGTKSVTIS